MNDQPTAAPAATPTQSMRQRMMQAYGRLCYDARITGHPIKPSKLADAMLDCLTVPPSPAIVDAGMNVGGLCSGEIETTWEAMVRTMIEEGKPR